MRREGWCRNNVVVLTELERRAFFKANWNKLVQVEKNNAFALSDQETRAVYTLYFTQPHPSESQRAALALARAQAKDLATCARIDEGEHAAAEAWLMSKLTEYAAIDPTYPLAIARGVAFYKRHQYADAARAFSQWLEAHPDGPWTLRVRNYLRASTAGDEETF
jgi:TolA-binding protein